MKTDSRSQLFISASNGFDVVTGPKDVSFQKISITTQWKVIFENSEGMGDL